MAAKSNQSQKNTVRIVLATAATITTLMGAQTLAFGGSANSQAQAQTASQTTDQTTLDVSGPTNDSVVIEPPSSSQSSVNQVYAAPYQPRPRSRASR